MRDFYIQKKFYDGWGTSERTERGILYTIHNNEIGRLGGTCWYINKTPYDVMIRLKVRPV